MFTRLALFAALAAISGSLSAAASKPGGGPVPFAERIVRAQNAERAVYGFGELAWDASLARDAAAYAAELAATGKWQHSDSDSREGQGENLWMGTRSAFTTEEMVDGWLTERTAFRPGVFPNVSKTGSWNDVGHYTQIIWPQTVKVGCAVRSSTKHDYLVCRYSEPGNVMGKPVRAVALASR
jgi:hypothetical protein